ncbi:Flp pilus assembly complex ATPase component TadA (plasmid) [Citricoccus nitrophenolicus]
MAAAQAPAPVERGFPSPEPQTYFDGLRPEPLPGFAVYSDVAYPDDYLQDPSASHNEDWLHGWLDAAMQRAMVMRASDMNLETESGARTVLKIDIRVDGLIRPMYRVEGQAAAKLMGHFKVNAGLATSGAFKPEESIKTIMVDGEERKARVASVRKSNGGDAVVMRLPLTGTLKTLDQLSFSKDNLKLVRRLLGSANQMVMLAGPMGSGKTTTAHGCLMELNTGRRTIWSIEDPVERALPGVIQLEINEEQHAGFKELLPTLMRSDYNTLFLGEIRDLDTAAAGIRQAKAGRQVLTTIHANDNVGALMRLIDLAKVSPREALDSVRGVVSQRLVAKLNPNWHDGMDPVDKYLGRVPVHEVLTLTPDIVEAMCDESVTLSEVREMAYDADMSTFEVDCERLVMSKVTDEEQVNEVFGGGFGHEQAKAKPSIQDTNERLARSMEFLASRGVDERVESAVRTGLEEAGFTLGEQRTPSGRRAALPAPASVEDWDPSMAVPVAGYPAEASPIEQLRESFDPEVVQRWQEFQAQQWPVPAPPVSDPAQDFDEFGAYDRQEVAGQ